MKHVNTLTASATLAIIALIGLIATQMTAIHGNEVAQLEERAAAQARMLNESVMHALNTVDGLRTAVENSLRDHAHIDHATALSPETHAARDGYIVPWRIHGTRPMSLFGLGDTDWSPQLERELRATTMASPMFLWVRTIYPETPWVYYLSKRRFMAIYPYVAPEDFFMDEVFYSMELFTLGAPESNPSRSPYITHVYEDEAGKGLMVTLGAPAYIDDRFLGIAAFDLTVASLSRSLQKDLHPGDRIYLINHRGQVIAQASDSPDTPADARTAGTVRSGLIDLRPDLAAHLALTPAGRGVSRMGASRVTIHPIGHADWQLIAERSEWRILRGAVSETMPLLAFLAILLAGILMLSREKQFQQQREAMATIERQATVDALTNLPNRRLLGTLLKGALSACRRHEHFGALLFLDLDNFKHINDSLGHPAGDELLIQVAARLREVIRAEDTAARLGGDEFVVLLPEVADDLETTRTLARQIAEKIRVSLSVAYHVQNHQIRLTPSIGIAIMPSADDDADDLLKHADAAMYRAKDAGRNAIQFYESSMQFAAKDRLQLQNDIVQALERGEFTLHFQPQVTMDGRIVGAEALIRWQHPTRGNIPPPDFIPLAEQAGQILDISDWVLREAISLLKESAALIDAAGLQRLSINLSARQFKQADFVQRTRARLAESATAPRRLTLEITENVLVDNVAETITKIEALKHLGVRFSIDDFGTGYSSLSYLKKLPIDEVKIDRSFIRDLPDDRDDANLVRSIITIANNMALDVIAEGVETTEQRDFLDAADCPRYQGYYFSRPLEKSAFLSLLAEQVATQVSAARR